MAHFLLAPKKKEVFDDLVVTPATARRFANGLLRGHQWHILLWRRSSRATAWFLQEARHGGPEGLSRWKASEIRAGLTKPPVMRSPLTEPGGNFAQPLPFGLL